MSVLSSPVQSKNRSCESYSHTLKPQLLNSNITTPPIPNQEDFKKFHQEKQQINARRQTKQKNLFFEDLPCLQVGATSVFLLVSVKSALKTGVLLIFACKFCLLRLVSKQ